MIMRTFLRFLFILMLCKLHVADEYRRNGVENSGGCSEDVDGTQKPEMNGSKELELQIDIWDELRNLQDLVIKQNSELKQLTERVEELQTENTVMKARMTAAETLVEESQMESDAQATEFAVVQKKFSTMQKRMSTHADHLKDLQKQQEVRKVAFSTSLLATGAGNTEYNDYTALIFKNIFTNIGNHYHPITGYFTAPERGVYYFRFTGHAALSTNSIIMRLVKNEQPIVLSGDRPITSTDPEDNVSNGAVLQLEAGDLVSVQLRGEVWDDHYHRTTFSGFMLFPL